MDEKNYTIKVDNKIELRLPDVAFAKDLFQLIDRQREYLREFLWWVDFNTEEKHSEAFLKDARMFTLGGQQVSACIFYNNKICGLISLIKIDRRYKNLEIGYWLDQDLQGKGIITKCCEKFIHHAFTKMEMNRLVIRTHKDNIRSKNIPKRLGFTYEGTQREVAKLHEEFIDLENYSLLRKEWME